MVSKCVVFRNQNWSKWRVGLGTNYGPTVNSIGHERRLRDVRKDSFQSGTGKFLQNQACGIAGVCWS
ncbi:hypothetical protein ACS0TY_029602 [Phlomoides rotata]